MRCRYYPDYLRHCPYMEPAWRWQRACSLVEEERNFSRHRDDEETGRAIRYLRALASTSRRARMTIESMQDIHAARAIYEEGGRAKLLLEALQLARLSPEHIAQRTGTPLAVVLTYESLFFDCRARLDASGWVSAYAINRFWSWSDSRDPRAAVLKTFAYQGGPFVLDAVLPYVLGEKELFGEIDASTPEGSTSLMAQMLVALALIPEDANRDVALFRIMPIFMQRRRSTESRRTRVGLVAENADSRLAEVACGTLDEHATSEVISVLKTLLEATRKAA